MKKKIAVRVLKLFLTGLFLLYTIQILLTGYGSISFIYTGLFYFTLYQILIFVFKKINGTIKTNHLLLITSIFVSVFATEIVLRFVLKRNLTYAEKNGSINYASFYIHSHYFDQLERKRKLGEHRNLLVSIPNLVRFEKKSEFKYEHRYNSLGLRNDEIKTPKPANEYRILGLGDSFTEGIGAPQDSSWLPLLQNILQQKTSQYKINCINAGHAGSDPVFDYQLLKEKLHIFQPDMVILAINGSDPRDIFNRGGQERYDENGNLKLKKGPWWEYFYGTSFLVRIYVRDVLKYNDYLVKEDGFEEELMITFDVIYETILKFRDLSKQENFQFKVVFMPFYNEMYDNNIQLESIYKFLVEQNLGKYTIYLPDCYLAYMNYYKKEPIDFYWPIDSHHNSKGYQMMAECIADRLSR
jgi:hypothetical protein